MDGFQSTEQLEDFLSLPTAEDIAAVRQLNGDYAVLGAGGKMGPTLAMRLRRALDAAGSASRVYAVSRFSDQSLAQRLAACGIIVVPADLLEERPALPEAENIIYLAGRKFGSTGQAGLTWRMNVVAPDRAAARYAGKRFVALSSGNIYPLRRIEEGGATEACEVGPVGEYAQSVLGRERILEYHAESDGTPTAILRLNYAVEPRYGVLVDLAMKIWHEQEVDLSMGYVNLIWQGDANSVVLRSLLHTSPHAPKINLTGLSTLRVRQLATDLAARLGKSVSFRGQEAETALLNDASLCAQIFGAPPTPIEQVLDWTADWIRNSRPILGKPTHFQTRDGKF